MLFAHGTLLKKKWNNLVLKHQLVLFNSHLFEVQRWPIIVSKNTWRNMAIWCIRMNIYTNSLLNVFPLETERQTDFTTIYIFRFYFACLDVSVRGLAA